MAEVLRQKGERKTKIKDLIRYVNNNYDWIEDIPLVWGIWQRAYREDS